MMQSGYERKRSVVRRTSLGELAGSSEALFPLCGACVLATYSGETLRILPEQISRPPIERSVVMVETL
jgi:hypothetical protein